MCVPLIGHFSEKIKQCLFPLNSLHPLVLVFKTSLYGRATRRFSAHVERVPFMQALGFLNKKPISLIYKPSCPYLWPRTIQHSLSLHRLRLQPSLGNRSFLVSSGCGKVQHQQGISSHIQASGLEKLCFFSQLESFETMHWSFLRGHSKQVISRIE